MGPGYEAKNGHTAQISDVEFVALFAPYHEVGFPVSHTVPKKQASNCKHLRIAFPTIIRMSVYIIMS